MTDLNRQEASRRLMEYYRKFSRWEVALRQDDFDFQASNLSQYFLAFILKMASYLEKDQLSLRNEKPPTDQIIGFIQSYVHYAKSSRPRLSRRNGEEWPKLADEMNEFVVFLGQTFNAYSELETNTQPADYSALAAKGA